MSLIRATWDSLAELLSVRPDQVEDALASERLVQRTISRRGLFLGASAAVAAAALPTGKIFLEVALPEFAPSVFVMGRMATPMLTVMLGQMNSMPYMAGFLYARERAKSRRDRRR